MFTGEGLTGGSAGNDLLFSKDHEWVRLVDGVARIGITDFAQDALGDVVFVQMPNLGQDVQPGDAVSEVESTKSVSDIYAPLSGQIVTVNENLEANPALINTDPYGDGWICEIAVGADVNLDSLMNEEAYLKLVGTS
jgi:glycine cleavage system H protein